MKTPESQQSSASPSEMDQGVLIRWRGKQEGPYTPAVLEQKLAANELGLLHEIFWRGNWISLRHYLAEQENARQAERAAREAKERQDRASREAKSREQNRTQESANRQPSSPPPGGDGAKVWPLLRPHRGATILTLGLVGLLCAPLGIAAWALASSDLSQMSAGVMDQSGRGMTSTGRVIGIVATVLWAVGVLHFIGKRGSF